MKTYHISNIKWDTDGETIDLPSEVTMSVSIKDDEDTADVLSDCISDVFGWCHCGFNYEEVRV